LRGWRSQPSEREDAKRAVVGSLLEAVRRLEEIARAEARG
jgi:hypothetical protein